MIKLNDVKNKIIDIVMSYIDTFGKTDKSSIIEALHVLLNGNFEKYNFSLEVSKRAIDRSQMQKSLFDVNEKTEIRKQSGVYYTPEDVCKYITYNSIIMKIDKNNTRTYKEDDAFEFIKKQDLSTLKNIIFNYTFFDPTCGSGEFLINLFHIKLNLLKYIHESCSDSDIYKISKTIFGNDIQGYSTDISKIRLFFEISSLFKNKRYYSMLAESLKDQFYNNDYVVYNGQFNNGFDFVIGNPPYVEYGKFENKNLLQNEFGNIYADVIKNSINSLKNNGVIGFIIPLSYISTSRMNKIRNFVIENTNRQFILSFADRPDCLFNGVHQKLNILIARKGKQEHSLFSSNYKHWYKDERKTLLNGCEIKANNHIRDMFIPKIGNDIEENIFRKVYTTSKDNLFDRQKELGEPLFLNMRACFWIKSFTYNPGSNEYKQFTYKKEERDFINCVLNSSLFWVYWTITSDCWHITSKELKGFYIPHIKESELLKFTGLSEMLETKLNKTKKYIGTKQIDYEYKHKNCKKEIDLIDDTLASVYELTKEEVAYIKNFALKYRIGGDSDDKYN